MKASSYAVALYRVIQDKKIKNEVDTEKVLARFFEVVSARGDEKLRSKILKKYVALVELADKNNEMVLVTPDSKSESKWSHAYDHFEKEGVIPEGAIKKTKVDETIIGGFQIRSKKILIDGSYKKSLIELYHNTVNKK